MTSKIDYKEINKLIRLMEEKNLSHFELEVEGLKIKIGRDLTSASAAEPAPALEVSKETEEKANNTPSEPTLQEGKNDFTTSHLLWSGPFSVLQTPLLPLSLK